MSEGGFVYERPWMYPAQEDAIFCDARYSLTEASVQSGKTIACVVWLFERAYKGEDGQNFWWVAPVSDQAAIAFRRMRDAIPSFLIEKKIEASGKERIELVNGAIIWFKSADNPDSLYGESVYAAVIDEASRVKEESWSSVRSRLAATGGPIRMIGNVKGRNNWFYKLCRKAEGGEDWTCDDCEESFRNRMHYSKITILDAIEAGVMPESELQEARDTCPTEAIFRELYLCEPADDGGNPFGIDHIRECIFTNDNGNTTTGLADGQPVVWGWDIAKAQNWTVGVGLNRVGDVCRFRRWQHVPWNQTIQQIIRYTGDSPALVDSTSAGGDQVLERLRGKQQDGTVVRRNFNGYKFTGPSKQDLMLGLAVAIQNHEVGYPDGPIVKELEAFEYEQRRNGVIYSAPEGMHDDCVDALALARRCYDQVDFYDASVIPQMTSRSAPWTVG